MIKHLFTTLLLSLALFGLTACENGSDETITIWHDKEPAVIAVLEARLAAELPDVTVEFVRKESLTDTLKLVGNNAKTAPDMYLFAHDKIGLFAEIGILAPITDLIDASLLENYLELTVEATTYEGVVYQLPFYFETLLFLYNKDRLAEEDVPTTTEELYTYMQENTDSRRYAFVEQYSNAYYSAGWIHGFGGAILDENNAPALNTQAVRDALAYHRKFLAYMPQGQAEYATVNTLFYEKKANSIIGGPWLVPTAKDYGIDLGFARMPVIDATGLPIAPYAGIQGIQVLRVAIEDEANRQRIVDVLNVLADVQIGIDLATASGVAPAHMDAYLDPSVTSNELVMAMRAAAEDAIPMPNAPQMDVMWTTAGRMLTEIFMNGADIVTATTEAQEESLDLIDLMD